MSLKRVLHRNQQIESLQHLFQDEKFLPQTVHIFGPSGTGKTKLTQLFLESTTIPFVYIDCVECFGCDRRLFEIILKNLSSNLNKNIKIRCSNANDFVLKLNELLKSCEKSSLVFVFDNAERLRSIKPDVLPILVRLIELTDQTDDCITILTISKLPWSHLSCQMGLNDTQPVQIFFPSYSKSELVEILPEKCPKNICSPQIFKSFLRDFVEIHYNSCRDLTELKFLIRASLKSLQIFAEAQKGKDLKPQLLWKFSESESRKCSSTLYCRGIDEKTVSCLDLPDKTKYILVAAYIASYNPPKTDSKFFLKIASRTRRNNKGVKMDESKSLHLRGPKMFSLERLCFIFLKIVHPKCCIDDNVFAQVSNLCSLKLIQKFSSDQLLDSVKYKCTTNYSTVDKTASTIEFDLKHYLNDFNL